MKYRTSIILLASLALALAGPASAQHHPQGHARHGGADHMAHAMKALHGGHLATAGDHSFETVCTPDRLEVFGYTDADVPTRLDGVTGTATVTVADGTSQTVALQPAAPAEGERTAYFCPMHGDATQFEPGTCAACGGMKLMAQNHLAGDLDVAALGTAPVPVHVELKGLPSGPVAFDVECAPSAEGRADGNGASDHPHGGHGDH
jgi:hypothetical protein